ncbi:DUF6052 family protein [Kitasatospora sp. NPDC048286]|uniref:DUF6052 family protein n=1 Tax=Kitasatospora sp. NPDC048286 TaxID=3364047 RepID=UPI003718F0D4
MTNEPVDYSPAAAARLSPEEEGQLRDCYRVLHGLAADCRVPSVRAAARAAVAELHAALDGQALDFEFYSHRWTG